VGARFVNNSIAGGSTGVEERNAMSQSMKSNEAAAKPRRRYDDQFKRRAVELSQQADRTVREVARELGMGEDLLYAWRREHGVADRRGVSLPPQSRSVMEIERENRELRAKLSEMEAREMILKKSLGILSETPGSGMPKWKR
jgi:transposase